MAKDNDVLLNVEQVRDALGRCSRQHVYNLVHAGKLLGVTIGVKRGLRIYKSSLDKYKREQETARKAA